MSNNAKPFKKRLRRFALWALLGLLIAAVILAILFILYPRTFNLDRVGRYFNYFGQEDQPDFGKIEYDANSTNDYAVFSDGLAVGSESGLTVFDLSGKQQTMIQGSLTSPTLEYCDSLCVCYSPGSSYLSAVTASGSTALDQTVSGLILDVDVSSDGYISYLSSQSGTKSVATVLNRDQIAYFKLSSRSQYLNVCTVSPRGSYLAVAGLSEQDSTFRSVLTILRTDEELPDLEGRDSSAVRVDLGNQIIYDLKFLSDTHLFALGQDKVVFFDVDGNILSELALTPNSLRDFSVGSGFLALALHKDQAGDDYELVTFDASGAELGRQELPDRIRNISAAGSYVDVLTDQGIEIYSKKLILYKKSGTAFAATTILARDDGTAFLVGNSQTRLYIP